MRANFAVPDGVYLLSHSAGPLTVKGQDCLEQRVLGPHREKGGEAWADWMPLLEDFCDALGRMIGGQGTDICPQVNVTAGASKYLGALDYADRPNIVMHATAFPTMGFAAKALERLGAKLVLIPEGRPAHDPNVWADFVDEQTAAVMITHVHSNTGVLSPMADIAKIANAAGAKVLVDAAQSVGVIPNAVTDWNVDAVFGSCLKWLCGGPGAGWMWVNPDRAPLAPIDAGWFSHADPFEFDIRHFEWAGGAKRFRGGTPSAAPYALALGGIETLQETGIENVRAHNIKLMQTVWPDVDPAINGGTLCLEFDGRADQVEARLKSETVHFDRRGDTLRLSFHIYNTKEEAELIRKILQA